MTLELVIEETALRAWKGPEVDDLEGANKERINAPLEEFCGRAQPREAERFRRSYGCTTAAIAQTHV